MEQVAALEDHLCWQQEYSLEAVCRCGKADMDVDSVTVRGGFPPFGD